MSSPAYGTFSPSSSFECALGTKVTTNGPSSYGPVRLHLDRELAESVQSHQVRQRARAVGPAAEAAGDRRRVDRVVEVGVADEHADRVVGRRQIAVERGRVGDRGAAQQQAAQRNAGEVGVDVEAGALVVEPVARDAEPLDLEPGGQRQRPRLELGQRLEVVGAAHRGQLMALQAGIPRYAALAPGPMCMLPSVLGPVA